MVNGTQQFTQKKLMKNILSVVEKEIRAELVDILQRWIQKRVYGRPQGPTYYVRTYQLYHAVDLKVTMKSNNTVAFSLFINTDFLTPVHRDGLDAYAAESGQYIMSAVPRMVNQGSNLPQGTQAPRFFEKAEEEILNQQVIETLLKERLEANGWSIAIS